MNQLNLLISGFYIEINFHKCEWHYAFNKLTNEIINYYSDFIVHDKTKQVNAEINIIQKVIIVSKKKRNTLFTELFEQKNNKIITYYQIGIIQFQLIINILLNRLLSQNRGLVLHGSACLVKNKAMVFLGLSGFGKSTLIKMLNRQYPALADDSVIIRKIGEKFYFFQTPVIEKEDWIKKSKIKYQLGKIFIIKKSSKNLIEKFENQNELIEILLNQLIAEKQYLKKNVQLIENLMKAKSLFYKLHFSLSKSEVQKMFNS